jgi:branched-chain amino acid transport system substrate-binding protein
LGANAVDGQEVCVKAYRSLTFCVSVLLLAGAGGCQARPGPAEEVVIGADLELTGTDAASGKVYAQALQLRVDQINQDRLLGNRHLTLVVRDNRSDPATAAANVKALAADRSVRALVTGGCAACIVAAAGAVNEAKIPTISLARPDVVSQPIADRRYIFKLAPNADDDATVIVSELATGGQHQVAVASQEDEFGTESAAALSGRLGRAGMSTVATERLGSGSPAAAANRIIKAKPQAVVIAAATGPAVQLAKALRSAGFTGRLMFGSAAADNLFLAGDAWPALDGAGIVFTPTFVSDDIIATSLAKSSRVAWFRTYLATFGTYHAYASFAADAVGTIVEAIDQTNGTDRESLRTAIETTRMDGLSGPLRISPANHSGLMPQAVTLLVATNGRWRLAS